MANKNKNKNRSAVKKRFKVTGSGKLVRHKAFKSHLAGSKNRKRKRSLKDPVYMTGKIASNIKKMVMV